MNEIYLDSSVFVIAATQEGSKAFNLLAQIKRGEIKAVTSSLTIDEVLLVLMKMRGRVDAVCAVEAMFLFPNMIIIDATKEIVREAVKIVKSGKTNPRDAIHLATMQSRGISIIASSDADFDNAQGVRRVVM